MNHYLHYQRNQPQLYGADPIDMQLAETDMLLAEMPLNPLHPAGPMMHPMMPAHPLGQLPPLPLEDFGAAVKEEDVESAAFGVLLGALLVIVVPFILMASSGGANL